MSRPAIIAIAVLSLATAATAGETVTLLEKTGGNTDIFSYDFGPPKSPAMTLLGLDADASPPSTSLKAFVVSASNLFNGGGASAAIDIAPAALFGGTSNFDDYSDGSYAYRLLRRTRLGLAAINGSSGDDPVRSGVALGLSVSLLDSSDPLRAKQNGTENGNLQTLKACILPFLQEQTALLETTEFYRAAVAKDADVAQRTTDATAAIDTLGRTGKAKSASLAAQITGYNDALQQLAFKDASGNTRTPPEFKPLPADASQAVVDTSRDALAAYASASLTKPLAAQAAAFDKRADVREVQSKIEDCAKRASLVASYGADLDIGAGTFWRGKPGQLSELKNGGGALWASLQVPLSDIRAEAAKGKIGSVWMLAASGRYGWRETIATGDKVTPDIRADTLNAWAGIERRSESLLLAARYGYQQVRANDAIGRFYNRSGDRFLFQGQMRLGSESPLWLGLTYGNAGGTVDTYNAKRLLVTLAFSPPKPENITNIKD